MASRNNKIENQISNSLRQRVQMLLVMFASIFSLSISAVYANPVGTSQVSNIPAFLPMKVTVPVTEKLPIDGEWMINDIYKRIRIEGGRAYAIDSWLHLFVLKVEPMNVVSQDWQRTAPGQYSGHDLSFAGPFTANLMPNGLMNMQVQSMLGLVNLTLSPIRLDDLSRFEREMLGENDEKSDSYPEKDEYIEESNEQDVGEGDKGSIEDGEYYEEGLL